MLSKEEFDELRDQAEQTRRRYDEAVGSLKEAMKSLKKQHGYDSEMEAVEAAKELEVKRNELVAKLDRLRQKFMEKWRDAIREMA